MSAIEELRLEVNTLQAALDISKLVLAELNDERKEFEPDPEFDTAFVLKEATANYYIAEVEKKIKLLKSRLDMLELIESHIRGN